MKNEELKHIASELISSYSFPKGISVAPDVAINDLSEGVDIIWNVTVNHPESGAECKFSLLGPMMDFDFLADEFPDCEMGR